MERYNIHGCLGSGAFGTVWEAVHRDTGVKVAVKRLRLRFPTWEECLALPEVDVLRRLQHPSIVQLFEVVREEERLHLIFEFVGQNLYQAMKDRSRPLPEARIRGWLRQILQGLAALHAAGYCHRDIKPENLLVRGPKIKIADFGLVCTASPRDNSCTTYVATRWYRAPEILLRAPYYGPPVDLFAVGAVAAELFSLRPLFPGANELDQLACICNVMGPPSLSTWPQGMQLAQLMGFEFPRDQPHVALADRLPTASSSAVDLIAKLCGWDPSTRLTAEQALQHPYFQEEKARPLLANAAVVSAGLAVAAERLACRALAAEREQCQREGEETELGVATPLRRLSQRARKRQREAVRRQQQRGKQATALAAPGRRLRGDYREAC